jgi:hypothetical protein
MIDPFARAACRKVDDDVFFPPSTSPGDLGVHVCLHHCVMLDRCRELTGGTTWVDCVVAGQRWIGPSKSRVSKREPRQIEPHECPLCMSHPALSTPLKPCGTVAAYKRHKSRGEEPDARCVLAYRAAERARARRRRAA